MRQEDGKRGNGDTGGHNGDQRLSEPDDGPPAEAGVGPGQQVEVVVSPQHSFGTLDKVRMFQ